MPCNHGATARTGNGYRHTCNFRSRPSESVRVPSRLGHHQPLAPAERNDAIRVRLYHILFHSYSRQRLEVGIVAGIGDILLHIYIVLALRVENARA